LALALSAVHLGLSAFTKAPELQLDDTESEALAKATVNVLAQFDLSPDPKIVAIASLLSVCAQVYGPRALLISERRKSERKNNIKFLNNRIHRVIKM